MNKIEIQIPEGKEIDWQESAKQEKIVFKEKQLTYADICKKLFNGGHYFIASNGSINFANWSSILPNNSISEHQLECILAKNKLANVARYLNGEWYTFPEDNHYIIWMNPIIKDLHIDYSQLSAEHSTIIFKSEELAQQAIEILGEETVKLALTPLY